MLTFRTGLRRLALATLILCIGSAASSADKETYFNASAWELQYDLTFTASSQGTADISASYVGRIEYTTSLKRTLAANYLLDLRSGGPSISTLSSVMGGQDLSKMSMAEQQKFSMDMLSKMEYTANWISSGGVGSLSDDASEEQLSAAMTTNREDQLGTATLEYHETVKGDALRNEMGTPFSMKNETSHTGSGKVQCGGQITLELDVSASQYMLSMGYNWSDSSSSSVKIVEKQHQEMQGQVTDTTITSRTGLNGVGSQIIPDDSTQMMGMMMLLKAKFDPADGVIKGEHTLAAHYVGNRGDVPGTLIVRFTLTPRP